MRKTPFVTTVAVLSLALGIGANTAIFSVLDAFLLRSLPVKDPRQIVLLSWLPKNSANQAQADVNFPFPVFERLRHSSVLSGAAGFAFIDNYRVIADGRAEYARGEAVSGNYHAVLGVEAVIGRAFTDDDDRESATPVCVVSYLFWENRLGRDAEAIGKRIVLGSVPVTVVGVEPPEFLGLTPGYAADFRIPIQMMPRIAPNNDIRTTFVDLDNWWVKVVVRVPPGKEQQARAEANLLLQRSLRPDQIGRTVMFGRGGEGLDLITRQFRSPLFVLMAAVGLILLIACANVANLLLARAQSREKETSMRLALGASATRLVRQFLTESLLLAAAGGALGIVLAYRAGDLLVRAFTDMTFDVHPDLHVLAFTAGVTLLTGILFGLAPAIRASRVDFQPGIQRETPSRFGLSHLLIVAQLALSLVAVVGAGLYVRTLHNLRITDLGMNVHNLTVFRLAPAASGYTTEQAAVFARRVLERLQMLPGVESVALSRVLPLLGSGWQTNIDLPLMPPDSTVRKASVNWVTAGFFETMRIPVRAGRSIEARDRAGTPLVAAVSETFARTYFPNTSPIGKRFRADVQDFEIIGVVGDSKYDGIRRAAPPMYFVAYPQSPNYRGFAVELRTRQNAAAVAGYIRRAIAEIDPDVPLSDFATGEQTVDRLIRQDRLFTGLSSSFGALALLLAAIGLYGVRAYSVGRRTSEIAIRMALGANRMTITRMVLRETTWLLLFGAGIGLATAYGLTGYIQSMLYGLAARNFTTFSGAVLVLTAVAAVAGYLPARRAARVDPMVALRHE